MKIRTVSGIKDWTWCGGCWGKPGVYRIFDYLKVAGITDVYWRVFGGGLAWYPSKVAQVYDRRVYEESKRQQEFPQPTISIEHYKAMDFNEYDPTPDALEIAEEMGINMYLWYTIFEDDHGGSVLSPFAKDHPEYLQMDKTGQTYRGTFDWFFPEVREYKLAIVDELLQYPAKGMMLDFVRHNACPSADENGIHRFGYNPKIRDYYKKEFGQDPIDLPPDDDQWLSFKRKITTSFIKDIRKKMDATETYRELSLMLWPVDYAKWACIDIPLLTKENVVQMVTGMSIKYSFSPKEVEDQYNILKRQVKNDNVKILPSIIGYNGIFPPQIYDCVQKAEEIGVEEMMFYEAPLLTRMNLVPAFRAINLGVPDYKRTLTATRVTTEKPDEINWSSIPEHSDFIFNSGKKTEQLPSEKTIAQIAYNSKEIIFRFTCHESDMQTALAPIPKNPHNQYYLDVLGARTHIYYTNAVNLFLDPLNCHRDYFHVEVTPRNERLQETFVLDGWDGKWDSSIETDKDKWIATIRVPYKSMNISPPKKGDYWHINMLRGIRQSEETNIWFYILWVIPNPSELGRLEFA